MCDSRRQSVPGLVHVIQSRGNGGRNWCKSRKTFLSARVSSYSYQSACCEKYICTWVWEGVQLCAFMHTQGLVSVGMSVCVKITHPTVSAVCVPASACLRVCVYMWEWHSYIPAFSQGAWNKSWRKGGVVNTVTLSAEQPVCIISCGKQPRQTGDFQSHSGWPWCVRKQTFSPSLPPTISLPLILTSLCLSAFVLLSWAHTHFH